MERKDFLKISGALGLARLHPETGGQFTLGQNFPNPYSDQCSVPFILKNASDVMVELLDPSGRNVASVSRANLPAGEHQPKTPPLISASRAAITSTSSR